MVVGIGMAPQIMHLNAWLIGSGTIRRCGLVGLGVSLYLGLAVVGECRDRDEVKQGNFWQSGSAI